MRKRIIIPVILLAVSVLLMAFGRLSTTFADFYADNIFPYISTPYAFISGLVPVSVGEILTIVMLSAFIVGIPALLILVLFNKHRKKALSIAGVTVLWMLTFVVTLESLNCFTLYGCTRFSERFFSSAEHDEEQLVDLYAHLINKTNALAKQVPRDENGRFDPDIDPVKESRNAMKKASEKYPQLKGYYPKPKAIMFSFFMSQTNTAGLYIPYSMEATYNDDLIPGVLPSVMCHEFAHLKGFMQEDECNFISFIAASGSDNVQVQYSGYLDALEYVNNQIFESEAESGFALYDTISDEVRNDWFRCYPDNYWEDNKDKEVIPTEIVSDVSDVAADTSMKLNGVEDGIKSYSRMVDLLLDYYYPAS